ncbi:hypothetical protein Anas_06663 [Armadillidium nasatum]|uniref:SERTA domain-containing protein n=1 Tax=Armadillidium nasatum TaxID=96803 RepID=A0A5N5SXP6_9CRUS|nr:hypothetical protein Anas_06663 [Armadillidium nasatum]
MLPGNGAMGIDSCTSLSWSASHRRVNLTPARLRLKEERKRIIRALDAKYRTIDDHERGMLRFVLIRNNLRRLQREAREEKLARHRNNLSGSKVSNLSPSCLSSTRSRSPSPPLDYGYGDSISPTYGSAGFPLFGEDPPTKKQRLLFDDDNDKENEMDVEYQSSGGDEDSKSQSSSPCRPVDDAQEILRDLYETCINEGITDRQGLMRNARGWRIKEKTGMGTLRIREAREMEDLRGKEDGRSEYKSAGR